jgi:hypothetical protein
MPTDPEDMSEEEAKDLVAGSSVAGPYDADKAKELQKKAEEYLKNKKKDK